MPKCKIHVWDIAERPRGVDFVGRDGGSSKYLQKLSVHFQGPPEGHTLKDVVLTHFGYNPPPEKTVADDVCRT